MEIVAAPRKTRISSSDKQIHWKQLWSLAALYGSVIIGWIAYQNYQPRLLVQFNFEGFSFPLMVVQGLIVVITPLIAGRLGDKYRFQKGHRLPIISAGISVAAMIFMAVAFTLLGNPGEIFRWVLPLLIISWLVAMSIFTSPALSTMELFTPVDKLPRAMAVLTITGNLVYALEPVIVDIIDYLGAPLTFIAGGLIVFSSGYALKKNSLGLFKVSGDKEKSVAVGINRSKYAFILFMGLTVGAATSILFYLFPRVFAEIETPVAIDPALMVAGILLLSALISWPASYIVNKYGSLRSFWLSVLVIVISTIALSVLDSYLPVVTLLIIFSAAFTFLSVSSLPLAISRSAARERVFCVGIFFGGVAVPEAVLEALIAWT